MKIAAFLALLTAATGISAATPSDVVGGFRCGSSKPATWPTFEAAQAAYLQRSVAILSASLTGNIAFLKTAVAQEARPVHFYYDAGVLSSTGPTGVSELIRSIAPNGYELVRERGLPLPRINPCGEINITLTLRGVKPAEAYVARLKYKSGLLTDLDVQDADYAAGDLPGTRAQ